MIPDEDVIKKIFEKFEYHIGKYEYVPPKPIKLNKKVEQFCSDMDGANLEWSGCGQFWEEMKPNELEKMLSTLHNPGVLYIRNKDNSKTYYAERFGRRVTVTDKCPVGLPAMWLSLPGVENE